MEEGVYRTLAKANEETLFTEKGSKFLGYAFPVATEEEIKEKLEELWSQHAKATHICYAWQLGANYESYRANDDGEPSNSAGMPIYGQIQSFELTNVLVASVRYYGGTKLGVGGLITAYKNSAKLALEASHIIIKEVTAQVKLSFGYDKLSVVERLIEQNQLEVIDRKMEMNCDFVLEYPIKDEVKIKDIFNGLYGVDADFN